jgi:alpha-L-fucosidase
MNRQLTELLTNYGPIGAIWFDGMWDHKEEGFNWNLKEQYELIHRLQPKCMIGNNHHGAIIEGEDFQLFEQDLPGQNTSGFSAGQKVGSLPFESCQTMNNTWGYSITDKAYKSSAEIIRRLVRAAGMNSNFLLNIGPRPDGQIPNEAVKILQDLGAYMRKHSRSIYSTRGGVVPPQPWGVTTQRGKTLYIHILNTEKDGRIINEGLERVDGSTSILLPKGKFSIKSVKRMGTDKSYTFRQESAGTRIFLPSRPTTDITDYVLEAQLN